MLRRIFDGKMIGTLLIMIMTVCLSAYAGLRSADAWTLNPSDFRYDMSLYFKLASSDFENLDAYEIGAFVDDECRGLAEKIDLADGSSCLYMRIRSNSAEPEVITFLMREKNSGKLVTLKSADGVDFLFRSNEMVGLPSEPFILQAYYNVTVTAGEGGSVDFADGQYAAGTLLTITAVPDEGHYLSRWSDGVFDETRTITVEGDLDIVAEFGVKDYPVVFKIDNEVFYQENVRYGSTVKAPAVPEKTGYTFSGWSDFPEVMPAHELEITGTYDVNYYKLTFLIDNVVVQESEVAYGSVIEYPEEAPDKEGHSFEGWINSEYTTMPAADLQIYGSYRPNTHLVHFMIDGELFEEHSVTYGSQIIAPEAPEKEGYTFSGWEDIPETMPARDIQINGTYNINYYTIIFRIEDEILGEYNLPFGDYFKAPEAPEKEGYTFAGWAEFPETVPAHDLVIEGSYNVNYYKLTFLIDNVVVHEFDMAYGSEIEYPTEAPDKEGHSFEGWINAEYTTMPAEDLQIYGSYRANTHLVHFMLDGELFEEHSVTYGTEIVAPEVPEKEGYTFSGWEDLPEVMPATDLVINGRYDINYYKLTIILEGETLEEVELAYGAAIELPQAPEKEGYSFGGWGDVPSTMPAMDLRIFASYVVNTYHLLVYLNDEVYYEDKVDFGSAINIPAPSVPEGMIFSGWTPEVPETMPAHDLTISGTLVEDDPSAVEGILSDNDTTVTVFTISGQLLFKDVKAGELKGRLAPGLYIINGKKVLVK